MPVYKEIWNPQVSKKNITSLVSVFGAVYGQALIEREVETSDMETTEKQVVLLKDSFLAA